MTNAQKLIFYQLRHSRQNLINYCYITIDEKNRLAVCIDPAWEPESFAAIFDRHQIKTIDVFLTHHHYDHVNLAEHFATQYNSRVYMHAKEILFYGFNCKNLISIGNETPIVIGTIEVQPIFTPGHTVGSICYLIDGRLFSGDTLFIEGCGLCSGKGGDPSAMFDSLNRLTHILQPEDRIYPGHRYYAELGQNFSYLLQMNLYLQLTDRRHFIQFRMREGQKGNFAFQ